jgi:hypothetical protein
VDAGGYHRLRSHPSPPCSPYRELIDGVLIPRAARATRLNALDAYAR